jgi:murein DD-endopeptidase MepM/ murein hydrolase activator NlpD
MRRSLALAAACLLGLALPPAASAGRGGGMSYSAPSTGRPMVSYFKVQRTVREDRMPAVRFRIDEPGVERLRVRIAFVPLRGRRRPLNVSLGRRPTSRTTRVTWPRDARLRRGRYRVRLHAVDPWGRTLLRVARASGRATLTVKAKPKPRPRPVPKPTPAAPVGDTAPPPPVPLPGATGAFPVAGPHTYGDGVGAPRKGHTHEGADILAAEGVPVVAPEAGSIVKTDYQASGAGHYVVQRAGGRDFFFAHCQSGTIAVSAGQPVGAGQLLCRVGSTGSATGPHLHFEIWVGGWRVPGGSFVDPMPQLRSWDR